MRPKPVTPKITKPAAEQVVKSIRRRSLANPKTEIYSQLMPRHGVHGGAFLMSDPIFLKSIHIHNNERFYDNGRIFQKIEPKLFQTVESIQSCCLLW